VDTEGLNSFGVAVAVDARGHRKTMSALEGKPKAHEALHVDRRTTEVSPAQQTVDDRHQKSS
jgi:hypothetical protein